MVTGKWLRKSLGLLWAAGLYAPSVIAAAGDVPVGAPKEILVTGSRLPTAQAQTAQDVQVYDRPRIENSGQTSLSDFLATLPEVSLNSVESTNGATTVRLRGAVQGAALILINGRRTEPVTGGAGLVGYFDLNQIPLSMVERIEVLPTGSSAIYGGEALAGVVNIVLRSGFSGVEASAGYRSARNTDEKVYYAGAGWNTGDLNVSLLGNYTERTSLFGKDRAITASSDFRSLGGPNLGTPFFGVPANVSSLSGNLPGLNSSFAAVPMGSTGVGLKPSDFAATAGTQNTGSFNRYQSLIPDLRRVGGFLSADYRFSPTLDVFAELLATKYQLDLTTAPPFLQLATVPASNAFNPFGSAVRVSGVVQGAERLGTFTFHQDFVRPVLGARGSFGAWEWEISALTARDRGSQVIRGQPNTALLNAALASSDPATALNPFVDGPMASPSLLASIYSATVPDTFHASSTILDAFVRGPLAHLPAGAVEAVVGVEHENSEFSRDFDYHRNVKSAFAELRAPLLAARDARPGSREWLTLQGAARYDEYSDFGSRTTGQVGIEFRPAKRFLLRGTHATAFKPPTPYQLAAPAQIGPAPVTDPRRNRETVVVQQTLGGNRDLQPTTSRSSTVGFVWSPTELPALNVAMTGWWLHIDDTINFPGPQYIVDNEALYPGRVVRAPSSGGTVGPITSVDRSYVNFGTMSEQGIDGRIDGAFATSIGTLAPSLAATYLTKFDGSITPGAPPTNRLSRANIEGVFAPRWKATAALGWKPGHGIEAWVDGRYIGRYHDYTPSRTIGDVWYFDATLGVEMEKLFGTTKGSLAGMKLEVSVTNLTDKLPPYSTYPRGYDVYNYDLVGRSIFVRLLVQS